MTLESVIQKDGSDISKHITEETLLVHPNVANNTVEARATVSIKAPDGTYWEGERVIKIRMKKSK